MWGTTMTEVPLCCVCGAGQAAPTWAASCAGSMNSNPRSSRCRTPRRAGGSRAPGEAARPMPAGGAGAGDCLESSAPGRRRSPTSRWPVALVVPYPGATNRHWLSPSGKVCGCELYLAARNTASQRVRQLNTGIGSSCERLGWLFRYEMIQCRRLTAYHS